MSNRGIYECYNHECTIRSGSENNKNFCFMFDCKGRDTNPIREVESLRVFLGGTCGNSTWRDELKPILTSYGIDFFDPVIKGRDRTDEDRQREIEYRRVCDFTLYVITPDIRGVYSIAEVIDDSNRRPDKTLFLYLPETEDKKYPLEGMTRSLDEVGEMVRRNRAYWFKSWNDLIHFFERRRPERKQVKR